MTLRPARPEDAQRFQPITEDPTTRERPTIYGVGENQSFASRAIDEAVNADVKGRAPRLRAATADDAATFTPEQPMRSAREDAAGRGLGAYIANMFNPSDASQDPNTDASAFLTAIRRSGGEYVDDVNRTADATSEFGARFNAVQNDMAHYGMFDIAGGDASVSRAFGNADDAQAEADRRAAYGEGFSGREFWNTDALDVQLPFGPAGRGRRVQLTGPAAATAAGVADIGGAIVGALRDPTSLLGSGDTLAQRIISNMAWNAGTDVASQALDIAGGSQEGGYAPERTALSTAAGAVLPTAFHALGGGFNRQRVEPDVAPRVPQGDEDVTARTSRGTNDGVSSDAEQRAFEDAANRARAVLRERGVQPNQPGYREAFEAERATQLREVAAPTEAPAAQPAAQYVERARADLSREGVTPRSSEDYPAQVQQRATQYAAEDSAQSRQARADAEAQTQAAFDAALLADPATRVRTSPTGTVNYVRDTGQSARGRRIVEVVELDPATGQLRATGRTIKALPAELRDLPNRQAPSPADGEPTLSERDTSRIPTLPEDRVMSALKTDPGATVRTEADQQIVRNAAERGVDEEAVDRYRSTENDTQGGRGASDPDAAVRSMRERLSAVQRGEQPRMPRPSDEDIARIQERSEGAPHSSDISDAEVARIKARRDELVSQGVDEFTAMMRASREVSRETEFTSEAKPGSKAQPAAPVERTRTVEGATARLSEPPIEARLQRNDVSRETEFTNEAKPKEQTGAVPLAPRDDRAPPPSINSITLDIGGRVSRIDKAKADSVGNLMTFRDLRDAEAAQAAWRPSFEQAGMNSRVERADGGFIVRTFDQQAPVKAGPRPPLAPEPEAPRAAPEVDQLKTTVRELSNELGAFASELKRQREEMDDRVNRDRSRKMVEGTARQADDAEATPRRQVAMEAPKAADEMPTPEPATYRNGLYDDDYAPPTTKAADDATPGQRDIETDRPGLTEATKRRQALADQQRGSFGDLPEGARPVDGIPNWRHDVTPDRMARDFLAETSRKTDADRVAAIVHSGRAVSAVLDSAGDIHRLPGAGNVTWSRAFSRKAALSADVTTSQVLRATRSADLYGHGETVYVRIPDEPDDALASAVMKTMRALHFGESPVEIRLEVHGAGEPQVHVGWDEAKAALDAIVSRDYRPPHETGVGAFKFMDPAHWGMGMRDAVEHARSAMGVLLGKQEFLPDDAIVGRMTTTEPNVVAMDRNGKAYQTPFGETSYFFQRFRKAARIGLPAGVETNVGRRAAGSLEHDVLNSTRIALLENYGGKAELRMPERLTPTMASKLRDVVNALPDGSIRARVFTETGNSPMVTGRAAVVDAIDNAALRAENPKKIVGGRNGEVIGAMPFLDPAAWKRFLIEPSMRAMQRYIDSFHAKDPDRVAFWRELGEALSEPPKSGKRRIGAARAMQNLHDTMVVSDIGALRGMVRRYPDLRFTPEAAAEMGTPVRDANGNIRKFGTEADAAAHPAPAGSKTYVRPHPDGGYQARISDFENRNPIQWLADQVGTQPGSGRHIPRAYEQEVSQDTKRFLRRIDNIMSEMEQAAGRLDAAGHKTFAELVTGQPTSGHVTPEMRAAAQRVRRAFDDEWKASTDAGMTLGNRKNYLMRNFDEDLVVKNPQRFINLARDQWIDEGVDPAEALAKAQSLWTNIAIPASRRLRVNAETAGVPNPIAARQWSASADARMREFYINDIRKLGPAYIRRIATARAFARRFGQKGERMTAAYDSINRGVAREADRDLVLWHMNNSLGHHSQQHGRLPMTVSGALSWVQVLGVTKFLARTALLQWVEPGNIAMRENKGSLTALRHVIDSTKYLFDNSPKAKAERELADLIGLTGAAAKEMYLDARLNGLTGNLPRRFVNNVFDSYGITHMTERQRVYAMTVGEQALRVALRDVGENSPNKNAALSLLHEYGISEGQVAGMRRWLDGLDRLPREDRLDAIAYGEFENARAFRGALHDFAVKSIIEPTAAETPGFAKHPWMRMAYSLSSFQHAFTREALLRMVTQTKRAVMDGTLTPEDRAALLATAPAFLSLAAMQILVQTLRSNVFASQSSNEQTPLEKTMTNVSRVGAFGIYDTAINTLSSNLRYERDPAGLAAGPFVGDNINSLFEIIQGLPGAPSNSINTNSAEWSSAKETYSTLLAPAAAGLAAQVPLPGPLNLARVAASAYGTSSDASRNFATGVAGERFERRGGSGADDFGISDDWSGQSETYE